MSEAAPAIEAKHLTIQLGDHTALDDVSFTIPQGAFSAVVGPNGGGKTTLIKAVLGLIRPTSGEMRVLGREPRELPFADVGYVPQLKTLDRSFPALVIELVVTGITARWPSRIGAEQRAQAMAALESVGGTHLAEKAIGHLSGGELQRAYLARAMVRHPRLILLDEPATGMDRMGQTDMTHLLDHYRRAEGAAIMMITHDWNAALHHASVALVINRRLVACGPPHAAFADEALREAYGHVGHAHGMMQG